MQSMDLAGSLPFQLSTGWHMFTVVLRTDVLARLLRCALAGLTDMRELAIRIDPQRSITKDNVTCDLGGNVYPRAI